MSKNPYNHPGGKEVTMGYVEGIKKYYAEVHPDYTIPKYILFIERCLQSGYTIKLYRPADGVSKYVNVFYKSKRFKVRFSNHAPIESLEKAQSCDFFVGVTNLHVATTEDAWNAMQKYFGFMQSEDQNDSL